MRLIPALDFRHEKPDCAMATARKWVLGRFALVYSGRFQITIRKLQELCRNPAAHTDFGEEPMPPAPRHFISGIRLLQIHGVDRLG